MKSERMNARELENSMNETTNRRMDDEDERLNLDELLEVQGGINDKEVITNCGLGCFTGSVTDPEQILK